MSIPQSSFTFDILNQAIQDAKTVGTTSLANAIWDEMFPASSPTKSVDGVSEDVQSALDDVKPDIKYPDYKTSPRFEIKKNRELTASEKKIIENQKLQFLSHSLYNYDSLYNSNGNPIPATPANPNVTWQNIDINRAGHQNDNNKWIFDVTIGIARDKMLINCIENSKGERISFINNRAVVEDAVSRFNGEYNRRFIGKRIYIINCGNNASNHNVGLTCDVALKGLTFQPNNSLMVCFYHELGENDIDENYSDFIKNNCNFFIEGEIFLDEAETTIVEMNISSLNYINFERMHTREELFSVV